MMMEAVAHNVKRYCLRKTPCVLARNPMLVELRRNVFAMRRFGWAGLVAAYLGIFLTTFGSIVIPRYSQPVAQIWLANAIFLAVFFRAGSTRTDCAKSFIAGSLAILGGELAGRGIDALAFLFTIANIVEVAAAAAFLRLANRSPLDLTTFSTLLVFLGAASIAAPAVAAMIAATSVYVANGVGWISTWKIWFISDALGMAIIGPFALTFKRDHFCSLAGNRDARFEIVIIGGLIMVTMVASIYYRPLVILSIPAMVVSAFRLGLVGTALTTLCITFFGSAVIVSGIGSPSLIAQTDTSQRLFLFQFFIAANILWALPVAALVGENKRLIAQVFVDNKRLNEESAHKSRMLMELHRSLIDAEERERLRLARELHDETAQSLAVSLMELKRLEPLVPAQGSDRIVKLRGFLEEIGKTLHHIARQLRPTSIDDCGLAQAIQDYLHQWNSLTNVELDFHCADPDVDSIAIDIRLAAFRFIQEALTNIAKHAEASLVSVVIERVDEVLHVSVEDNGRGFDPDTIDRTEKSGLGLLGMRERIALIGGSTEIQSSLGSGATVFARIPLCGSASA